MEIDEWTKSGLIEPAYEAVQRILDATNGIIPCDGVMLTGDGGAACVWARSRAYAEIECSADGALHLLLLGGRTIVDEGEIHDLPEAVERVRRHLDNSAKSNCK